MRGAQMPRLSVLDKNKLSAGAMARGSTITFGPELK
jgi:hypothetical protein